MNTLTIRQPQMAALSEAYQVSWLRKEIESLYPAECESMGSNELARFVAEGLRRSKSLGFASRHHLSYLALVLCFGEGFLDQPENEWARGTLAGDKDSRMERLRHAAILRLAGLAEHEQRQKNIDAQAQETL